MGCDVYIEPREIESRTTVHCNCAQKRAKEFDGVTCRADDENVTDDAKDVGKGNERASDAQMVGNKCQGQKARSSENVNGDSEVLSFDAAMAHTGDDGREKRAKTVQKYVLAELNGSAFAKLELCSGHE